MNRDRKYLIPASSQHSEADTICNDPAPRQPRVGQHRMIGNENIEPPRLSDHILEMWFCYRYPRHFGKATKFYPFSQALAGLAALLTEPPAQFFGLWGAQFHQGVELPLRICLVPLTQIAQD